jgi:hypothetical protein
MIASIFFMGFRLCIYGVPGDDRRVALFLVLVKHEPCQPAMPRPDKAAEPQKQAKQAIFAQKMGRDA